MSPLKKTIKLITNIFTGLLLVLLILVIYGKLVITFSKNGYPNYFGYTFFEVASGSMEPTLHINDVILVKVNKTDLKKNDIIAFNYEKSIITHRIVFIDGDVITVKGDNNNTVDKPITVNQVIGKVVHIYPKLGIWKKVITDPKVLILIFVTLLLFDYALAYNGKDKKEVKDKKPIDIKKKLNLLKPKVDKKEKKQQEVIIKKIELPEEKRNVTESEKLLELTRKIDIEDINKLLEGTDLELNKQEVKNVKEEIKRQEKIEENPIIESQEEVEEPIELSEKEQNFIDYTIRLDLSEIQKRIDDRIR